MIYGMPGPCLASVNTLEPVTGSTYSSFLPATPVWPGLALNTLFYAAWWSLPLVVAPALLRWRRDRRGGCTKCGYDLAGLSVCPECGLQLQIKEATDDG